MLHPVFPGHPHIGQQGVRYALVRLGLPQRFRHRLSNALKHLLRSIDAADFSSELQQLLRCRICLGLAPSRTKSIAVSYDGRISEGVYRVQTVNNYHERFKTWVNRQLRGVSTRHLPNYLAWMRLWEWFKEGIKPEHFVVSGLRKQLINIPATS